MNQLAVLKVEVDGIPQVTFIDDNLKAKQTVVGGLLDYMEITKDIDLWFNDEGNLLNMDLNFTAFVEHSSGARHPVAGIAGNVFFASHDEDGNTVGLNMNQVIQVLQMFQEDRKKLIY